MISRYSIETAYTWFHQKLRVYEHSSLDWQRDDIEVAIASFVDDMSPELFAKLANESDDFLRNHQRFQQDLTAAVEQLERMLGI